jgi:hypothetical protein
VPYLRLMSRCRHCLPWRRRSRAGVKIEEETAVSMQCTGGGASHRFSAALRSDRARVLGGATGNAVNLVPRAPAPTSSFYFGAARRGPTWYWLGCAPSGRVIASGSVVGPIRG